MGRPKIIEKVEKKMSKIIVDAAREELKGLSEEIKHVESVLKELKQAERKLNKVIVDFSEVPAPAVDTAENA